MIFSSPSFLFFFLPLFLVLYTVLPKKNLVLVCASLVFYTWGEPVYILLMLAVIAANYIFGLALEAGDQSTRVRYLILGVTFNVGILFYFKYAGFFLDNLSALLQMAGFPALEAQGPPLPLGISFLIFHSLTYVIDIYWNRVKPEHSLVNLGLYLSLFPQLVAGPIVRFREIAGQIHQRSVTFRNFSIGCERFIFGLAKKVLLADTLAVPADAIFAVPVEQLPALTAWFGAVCFGLQIYYDFSAYSDMAIGLGRMLGFRFPENFRHPYESVTLREFWRRWHMTLSRWFRDYLYIPIGGNRGSTARTYANLVLIFFLTGLWHGASWTYVIWGLIHGAFMTLERVGFERWLARRPRLFQHLYLLFVVQISWVFFRAEDLDHALGYLKAMFFPASGTSYVYLIQQYSTPYVATMFVAGILLSSNLLWSRLNTRLLSVYKTSARGEAAALPGVLLFAKYGTALLLISLSLMAVAAQSHRAFIYFRF